MKGALAKAPGFDEVAGFDPAANGLWTLRVHVDKLGFVWCNMDTSEGGITWEEQFGQSQEQQRLQGVDMEKYEFSHSWGMEDCAYNWKALLDNYNEVRCRVTSRSSLNQRQRPPPSIFFRPRSLKAALRLLGSTATDLVYVSQCYHCTSAHPGIAKTTDLRNVSRSRPPRRL